mmetsp:Transcript_12307/g.35157  ORF Transcript_12307/g.35157 Transcript_12307/m.35157 type:complete len:272 (+) Transcript_12307:745-1560(+)
MGHSRDRRLRQLHLRQLRRPPRRLERSLCGHRSGKEPAHRRPQEQLPERRGDEPPHGHVAAVLRVHSVGKHAVAEEGDGAPGCAGSHAALPRAAHLAHEAALEYREDRGLRAHSLAGRFVHRLPADGRRQPRRPNGTRLLRRALPHVRPLHLRVVSQTLGHDAHLGTRLALVELGEERLHFNLCSGVCLGLRLAGCAVYIGVVRDEPVRSAVPRPREGQGVVEHGFDVDDQRVFIRPAAQHGPAQIRVQHQQRFGGSRQRLPHRPRAEVRQ